MRLLNRLQNLMNPISLLATVIVLFICIPIHEAAHAYTAHKLGDPTAKNQGRLTVNPFAHLSLMGTIFLVLFGYGWAKPVPVNSSYFKNPKRDMGITAAAGPLPTYFWLCIYTAGADYS